MNKVKAVCKYCGSENVTSDALAEWDEETQNWSLVTTLQNEDCRDCEASGNIIEWKGIK